jgi:hypothetical protein
VEVQQKIAQRFRLKLAKTIFSRFAAVSCDKETDFGGFHPRFSPQFEHRFGRNSASQMKGESGRGSAKRIF